MHMLTLKQDLHLSKAHSKMKTFMNKNKETAPNWSFILTPSVATNKFSEFCQICVDPRLNLVFIGRVILRRMPSNSSMVFIFGIDIISFGYGGLLGLAGMTKIP